MKPEVNKDGHNGGYLVITYTIEINVEDYNSRKDKVLGCSNCGPNTERSILNVDNTN